MKNGLMGPQIDLTGLTNKSVSLDIGKQKLLKLKM